MLKTPSPHPSLLPGLDSWILSSSPPWVVQGDREWGLGSVHHTLSLPLLPPQGEDSSHSAPAPARGPSHRRQSSMNCSSVGPSHGVQSLRNRLLPRGSPTWSQVLPATCSSVGSSLHGATGYLPGGCSSTGFPRGHSLLGVHPPALVWGPPWAAGGDLLHHGPPRASEGQSASPWSSPRAAGESLLPHLEHFLTLLLPWPQCLQNCFSHIFSLLSPPAIAGVFFPLLNYVIPEVQPTPLMISALGQQRVHLWANCHWLYQTQWKLLTASHRSHPCSPPTTKTLPHKPNAHYLQQKWWRGTNRKCYSLTLISFGSLQFYSRVSPPLS